MKMEPVFKTSRAGVLTVGTGTLLAVVAAMHGWFDWPMTLTGIAISVAGCAHVARPSILSLALIRGGALAVLVPKLFVFSRNVAHRGELPRDGIVLAALSLATLFLSTRGDDARIARTFPAVRYRRFFQSGAAAAIATAFLSAHLALVGERYADAFQIASFGSLSLAYAASSLAILRMRTWGVVALVATSASVAGAYWGTGQFPYLAAIGSAAAALVVAPLVRVALSSTVHVRVSEEADAHVRKRISPSSLAQASEARLETESRPCSRRRCA